MSINFKNRNRAACTAVALLMWTAGFAFDFMSGGLAYNIVSETNVYVAPTNNNYQGLSTANIPEKVTYNGTTYQCVGIQVGAFDFCKSLTSVKIPKTVVSILGNPFAGCDKLSSITVDAGNPKFDSRNYCNAIIRKETNIMYVGCKTSSFPSSVTGIGPMAFSYCAGLTQLSIPNSIQSIGEYAFEFCGNLTSVTIPASVTSISNHPFRGCTRLSSIVVNSGNGKFDSRNNCNAIIETSTNRIVSSCRNTTIPSTVKTIGQYAFAYSDFSFYDISPSITKIESSAFENCTQLEMVRIPSSITSIASAAFAYGLNKLKYVYCCIENPSLISVGKNVFGANDQPNSGSVLIVPSGCRSKYLSMNPWRYFSTIVEGTLIESLSFNHSHDDVYVNETLQLPLLMSPVDAYVGGLSWTTSDATIATVEDGIVFGRKVGTAIITVEANAGVRISTSCQVNVIPRLVTSVTISQSSASLLPDETVQLSATVLPSDATDQSVTWQSSNTNVATVSGDGMVVAKGVGTCVITATAADGSGKSATCQVTVSPRLATSVTLNTTSASVMRGNTLQLTATVFPTNATNRAVTWKTSNSDIATVDSNGKVTGKNIGKATITATTADGTLLTASCLVTVKPQCDVNNDGAVDLFDINAIINRMLGIATIADSLADVNGDGSVDIFDVNEVVNAILAK